MFSNLLSDIVSSVGSTTLAHNFSVIMAKTEVDASNAVDVAAVVVSGLAVVFVALIILILFVLLYGKVFDVIRENKNKKKEKIVAADMTPVVNLAKDEPIEEPVVADMSEDDEIIAAISAVIAQISSESGVNYRIKSVTPLASKASRRNVWGLEGLRQNTNPF